MYTFILVVVLNTGTPDQRQADIAEVTNIRVCNIAAKQLNQHPENKKNKTLFYCDRRFTV